MEETDLTFLPQNPFPPATNNTILGPPPSPTTFAVEDGYEPLAEVLQQALDQAQHGKGKRCHADDKPFLDQPIMRGARECGPGSMAYQSRKKILEALRCPDDDRAIEDLLGAINYIAAQVILRREQTANEAD